MNIPFMNPENNNNITKTAGAVLVVLAIFLLAQTVNTLKEFKYIGGGQYPDSTVSFSGTGEVFAVPDVATFTFTVTKEASTVDAAQKAVEDVIAVATKSLKDEGVEETDIKTTNYNVYPRYDYVSSSNFGGSERVFKGYEVSQTTSVKVKEAAKSGDILGKIGSLEVTNVSGLSFQVDDTDELKREARQLAIEDAKEKAEALSKDLGIKLVRIISFYEDSNDGGYPYPMYESAMGGDSMSVKNAAPTFSVGENKIATRVTITYEIR